VLLSSIFGVLACLSLGLLLWQWVVARRFPLHQSLEKPEFAPPVTLLKPLKGVEAATEECLRSWFQQQYAGTVEILFGVASDTDPVCPVVEKLIGEFPKITSKLRIIQPLRGANAKVSKLLELETLAQHEIVVISDADVRVPPDFLTNTVPLLEAKKTGLVNCFYRLANPVNVAMRWEALAVNADFWSQVLQAQSLKPLDFALGAVMLTRRSHLREIGGFEGLLDCLADDFQLGHRIARKGYDVRLGTVVVECWSDPQTFSFVWKHQLRWARTIRVCQPLPYFFSILSNATLWPLLWFCVVPGVVSGVCFGLAVFVRWLSAVDLERRLEGGLHERGGSLSFLEVLWLAPMKDLLQALIWALAFLGNRVEWRGQRLRLRRDGTLVRSAG
jgi:ceramide glucosyltransferase